MNFTSQPQKKQGCKDFQSPAHCQIFWITNETYKLHKDYEFYEQYMMHEVGVAGSGKLWRAISSKKNIQRKIMGDENWLLEHRLPGKAGSKIKKG